MLMPVGDVGDRDDHDHQNVDVADGHDHHNDVAVDGDDHDHRNVDAAEGDDHDHRNVDAADESPPSIKATRHVVLSCGGGEGNIGIPNALLIFQFDVNSYSLSDDPVCISIPSP
ncbi:hypothetical protein POM88_015192 [Heracleum sosnowskyi]|uniref:Uncharacterized protein n=1 Tax=Heracleum sosnowskyi TaxID=360622 RepID=A0AAD8IL58_9APIA|nr:hypothetical protein POM88_015192 [Heracleum sosnowskyi]